MKQGGIFGHGRFRILHDWQIFVFHLNLLNGFGCNHFILGDNRRHLITDEAHPVRMGFIGTRTTQHRLIKYDQAVFIDWNILGSENRNDSFHCFRLGGVDRFDDGMWAIGKQDLHHCLIGPINIAGIERFAGNLTPGIQASYFLTDCRH